MGNNLRLSDVADFVTDRISIEKINVDNYISTENMIVNKGGVTKATNLPPSKTALNYKENDILISNIRLYFKKIWLANRQGGASSDVLVLRTKKDYSPRFIYYVLSDSIFFSYADVTSKGTKMPRGDKNAIMKYTIPRYDVETQHKIANVLSTYDKLIENNNRRIEVLEQSVEEIYKEWFVRMRFPGYENTKFNKGIPVGWEVKKLGSLINISSSKRVYSSDYVESGVPFYRSKEVIQLSNGETISDMLYISDEKYRKFKEKFGAPQKNDILLTSVGTIGVPMLVRNNNPFYFKDGNLTWIQSSSNAKLANYLYYWLKSGAGQQQILSSTIGTSQSALTIENLKRVKVIIPEDTVLSMFNDLFSDIIESISNFTTQNQSLIRQRDLLLPRLMNGTIEVK
jgi:type I restriction enzyme, S subunit